MQEMPEMHHVLPDMVCTLLGKSLDIYQRAARLDELLAEDAVKTSSRLVYTSWIRVGIDVTGPCCHWK